MLGLVTSTPSMGRLVWQAIWDVRASCWSSIHYFFPCSWSWLVLGMVHVLCEDLVSFLLSYGIQFQSMI
jgi:hypothetical protein